LPDFAMCSVHPCYMVSRCQASNMHQIGRPSGWELPRYLPTFHLFGHVHLFVCRALGVTETASWRSRLGDEHSSVIKRPRHSDPLVTGTHGTQDSWQCHHQVMLQTPVDAHRNFESQSQFTPSLLLAPLFENTYFASFSKLETTLYGF